MVNFNATLIAQVLNFLILVFILAKFAYKPLMKIMDDRKNKIAGDLAAAETAKTDAESIKAEYAAKLAAARQEAQAIIDNARKTAQTAHDKILADTKAEQDQIVKTDPRVCWQDKPRARVYWFDSNSSVNHISATVYENDDNEENITIT